MNSIDKPKNIKSFYFAIIIIAIYNCIFSQLYSMQLISGQLESFIPVIALFFLLFACDIKRLVSINIWIFPFLLLFMQLIMHFSFGLLRDFVVWMFGICLISSSYNVKYYKTFFNILYIAAILYTLSILFQFLFPDIYFNYYFPLFKGEYSDTVFRMWSSGRNIASGLSHQIGYTVSYIVVGLGLHLYVKMRGQTKKKRILLLILFFIGLVLAQKRAHFAASIISIGIVYFLSSSKNRGKLVFYMLITLLILLFITINLVDYLGVNSVLRRYEESIVLSETGESLSYSRDILRLQALSIWSDNPILGIGWNQFGQLGKDYTTVHNVYIQLLCETGIVGFICFTIPIFYFLYKTVKLINKLNSLNFAPFLMFSTFYQIFFILYCFTGNPLYDYPYLIPYLFSIAIANYYLKRVKL